MRGEEIVLCESDEQVGLTHSAISDDQQFDEMIVTLFSFHVYPVLTI